jgi:hypothetical protein
LASIFAISSNGIKFDYIIYHGGEEEIWDSVSTAATNIMMALDSADSVALSNPVNNS